MVREVLWQTLGHGRLVGKPVAAVALVLVCSLAASDGEGAAGAPLAELDAYPHQILYERYDGDNWELYVMNADGSGKENLTMTPDIHELYPQASPDGTKICFLADVAQGEDTLRSVYYMNADGSDRVLVAEKARQPCWSPEGRRIAFVKQEFDKFNVVDFASKGICFYDVDTGEIVEHPNPEIEHLYNLNWSANGRWIVTTVHAGMGFRHGIIAIECGGRGVYDLGIPGCRPCMSADGKRVTWSPDDHTINVADIELSATEPKVSNVKTLVRKKELHQYHPDFSPDGKYVTYSVGPGGRTQARGPGTHTQVAEIVGVPGKWNIFLKRVDGKGPALELTHDENLCNKESEWLPACDDAP